MLVALQGDQRIVASVAQKGKDYNCPGCNCSVILKKGEIVVHHFAHKPPTECVWAKGETIAHLESKSTLADALLARGLRVELEHVVESMHGDRRADVMLWSPVKAQRIAFELQHTLIALEDIERRANSYAKSGIAQMWIPFMGSSIWQKGKLLKTGEWFVAEYSARPFERWIHGFNQGEGMWMYDPKKKMFWLGKMEGHQKYVSETTYYTEGGDENYGGGYYRYSKRYKELKLNGPFNAQSLKVELKTRKAFSRGGLNWPAGRLARFVVTEQKSEELMLTSSDSQPAPAPHG